MKKALIFLASIIIVSIKMQGQEKSFKELEKMSRSELIQMAVDKINANPNMKEAAFDINNFDRISVRICKGKTKEVWVSFNMSYKYIPYGSCYCYGFGTDLYNGINSSGPNCNPQNMKVPISKSSMPFYNFTDEHKKIKEFIINSINKNDKMMHIQNGKLSDDEAMLVYENESYYQVERGYKWGTIYFKIEKTTGKTYDLTSDTNAEPPKPKNPKKCYEKSSVN